MKKELIVDVTLMYNIMCNWFLIKWKTNESKSCFFFFDKTDEKFKWEFGKNYYKLSPNK